MARNRKQKRNRHRRDDKRIRKDRKNNTPSTATPVEKKEFKGVHHIKPRSRGGPDEPSNLYYWSTNHTGKHRAWHTLFANLLPEEACMLIGLWTRKDGGLDLRYFGSRRGKPNKRIIAWKVLFTDLTPKEAVEVITREFIRKEWLSSP